MLTAHRLYIASPAARELEGMVTHDPMFFTVGSGDGEGAYEEARALAPDVMLLDEVLTGLDGRAFLARMGREWVAPPRVAFLRRTAWPAQADAACSYPWEEKAVLSALHKAAEQPLPLLAAPLSGVREQLSSALAKRLDMKETLKGTAYLCWAAAHCACAPGLMRGGLYARLADVFSTSPGAAEKAVRAAIEDTWLHGNLPAIQGLFGLTVDAEKGKPTNLECIAMLAEHVRRGTEKHIMESKQ